MLIALTHRPAPRVILGFQVLCAWARFLLIRPAR